MDTIVHLMDKVKTLPGMRSALAVILIESNLGDSAATIVASLRRRGIEDGHGVVIMCEHRSKRGGVEWQSGMLKTQALTNAMATAFAHKLTDRSLCFHRRFVHSGNKYKEAAQLQKDIVKQLLNYKKKITPNNNKDKPPKITYSGKEGYGFDDHVVALLFNPLSRRVFWNNKTKYGIYHQ